MANDRSTWGTVHLVNRSVPPSIFQIDAKINQDAKGLLWRPDSEKLGVLDAAPGIAFSIETDAAGNRRLLPVNSADEDGRLSYFGAVWHYGFQTVCGRSPERFDVHARFSYRIMWFLFQRARQMRQYIRRRFRHKKDLALTNAVRHTKKIDNILPWVGNRFALKRNYPMSLDAFLEQGNATALEHGIRNPTIANKIEFGLLHAARLEPRVPLAGDEAARLIHFSLFDTDDRFDSLTPEMKARLEETILETMKPHIVGDDTQDEFDKWFAGQHSVFVKEVARQFTEMDEAAATEAVTALLVEYGWRAYHYLATCVQAIMHDVARSLPEPLSSAERESFELLYYPQPFFGGLPLVLLGDRLDTVRLIANELLASPQNENLIGELHCLLQFYAAMVNSRREADRKSKSKPFMPALGKNGEPLPFSGEKGGPGLPFSGEKGGPRQVDDQFRRLDSPETALEDAMAKESQRLLIDAVKELTGAQCQCESPEWRLTSFVRHKDKVRISLKCDHCGAESEPTAVNLPDLKLRLPPGI